MVDQNMEWMTQEPLALRGVLYKIPKWVERMNIKFNLDNTMKAKDHLDNFYLQLQTLEVQYEDVACILFPCTLDDNVAAWYQSLPPNSIQKSVSFKCMFLEAFSHDKTSAMLLKELGSLKMEEKEKVKDFNQRFTLISNKFAVDTKPHDSINVDYYISELLTIIE